MSKYPFNDCTELKCEHGSWLGAPNKLARECINISLHRVVPPKIFFEHKQFIKLTEHLTVEMPHGVAINTCLQHVQVPTVNLSEQQPAVLC